MTTSRISTGRPNVLFILSDQHNAKWLGHRGHPFVRTPALDRLAAEGVRFENAVTQNPICTPSRICFLSGQYAHNHGYYGLCGPKPAGFPTLPNLFGHFRAFGYATAAIGKIHCPEYWVEDDVDVFREVCGGCSAAGNTEYVAHIRARGLENEFVVSECRTGPFGQCLDGYVSPLPYRDTPEGWIVSESIEFMRRAAADGTPFLLHASFPRPHQTYAPTREFWDCYPVDRIVLPPNFDYDRRFKAPTLIRIVEEHQRRAAEWTVTEPRTYRAGCMRKLRRYAGNVSMMDHAVGELLDALRELGLEENTIVVYSSDHGDYACEHGAVEKAPGICSDAITRIPMIWRWPGRFPAGTVQTTIVEAVDVAPTLSALCGLSPMETADGKDLSAVLYGDQSPVREIGVTEFAWSKSLRKGRYRYVYYPREMFPEDYPDGFGELYDLEKDPWEMTNLYFDPAARPLIEELRADLMEWLITTTRVVSTNCAKQPSGAQAIHRFHCAVNRDGKIGPQYLRCLDNRNYL